MGRSLRSGPSQPQRLARAGAGDRPDPAPCAAPLVGPAVAGIGAQEVQLATQMWLEEGAPGLGLQPAGRFCPEPGFPGTWQLRASSWLPGFLLEEGVFL